MSRESFIRCICEQPAEDTTRLVFADWLDENGDPDRAEFIRVQCALHPYQAQREWLENMPVEQWKGDASVGELLHRLDPLVRRHTALCQQYLVDCKPWSEEFARGLWAEDWFQLCVPWYWGWSRGFVSDIHCGIRDFLKYAKQLFLLAPIDHVEIYDSIRGGTVFRGEGEGDLPKEVFAFLRRGTLVRDRYAGTHRAYETDKEVLTCPNHAERSKLMASIAKADVSQACIRWAREQADLPELYNSE